MTLFLGRTTSLTATAVLLAGTAVILPTAAAAPADPRRTPPTVRLSGDGVVRSATVELPGAAGHGRSATQVAGQTTTLRTDGFSMVAATWQGSDPQLEVRTLGSGGWSPWRHLHPLDDGPSAPAVHGASELLWVNDSSAVQVRGERTARGAELVLIDPGHLPTDDAVVARERHLQRATPPDRAPAPPLLTRRDWGADNRWRNGRPHYLTHLKQVHVHHTATGNDYSRRDVPGILRGIYRYHTKSLGWFDIGYNFLVDRFGRAWVGRSGGSGRLVRGAHTLGFNRQSVGVAVIGNLDGRRPWPDAVTTVTKLAAWKLDKHERDALGKVTVTSSGSDKYPDRRRVRLPVIDGHRDTNDTACPGGRLYAQLPEIRRRAQWRIDHW